MIAAMNSSETSGWLSRHDTSPIVSQVGLPDRRLAEDPMRGRREGVGRVPLSEFRVALPGDLDVGAGIVEVFRRDLVAVPVDLLLLVVCLERRGERLE
jgi:hypothetical protein